MKRYYRGTLRHLDKFRGRDQELALICRDLSRSKSVAINGDYESGKSSLLWYLTQKCQSLLGDKYEVFYIDLQITFTADDFYWRLAEELNLPSPESAGDRVILKELRHRKKLARRVVFCLDEIEAAVVGYKSEFLDWLDVVLREELALLVFSSYHALDELLPQLQDDFVKMRLESIAEELRATI